MEQFTAKQVSDIRVLAKFIQVYCHAKHEPGSRQPSSLPPELATGRRSHLYLCADCAGILAHGITKRRTCPLDPKPDCKSCRIHCYSKEYRARIREIMAFSGKRLILRGRLDYLWHFFF
jgi:YbgA-like uncharacterized protein